MVNRRLTKRAVSAGALVIGIALPLACGGSARIGAGDGTAGAGETSGAGATSGGAGGGEASSGGRTIAGDAGSCPITSCPRVGQCGLDSTPGPLGNTCCPSCVVDPACSAQQVDYVALREQLLSAPGASSCSKDDDCVYLPGVRACNDPCPAKPVRAAAMMDIAQRLDQFGSAHCSACAGIDALCIGTRLICSNGSCAMSTPEP